MTKQEVYRMTCYSRHDIGNFLYQVRRVIRLYWPRHLQEFSARFRDGTGSVARYRIELTITEIPVEEQ